MKPDYRRIAELEQQIYGHAVTPAPVVMVHEVDEVMREASRVADLRPGLPELAGSKIATAGRLVVLGLLGFAVLWLCLVLAGVVSG